MIMFSSPLIELLFQRGFFTGTYSTPMTAFALVFYSCGLFAFGGIKILTQAFYSLQDTLTPFKVACYAALVNIILNIILMKPLYHGGLALATSISALVNMAVLIIILLRRMEGFHIKSVLVVFGKVVLLSLIIIGGLHFISSFYWGTLTQNKLGTFLTLTAIGIVTAGMFVLLSPLIGLKETWEIIGKLRSSGKDKGNGK